MLSAAPVRCPITLDERPLCPQITPCGAWLREPAGLRLCRTLDATCCCECGSCVGMAWVADCAISDCAASA